MHTELLLWQLPHRDLLPDRKSQVMVGLRRRPGLLRLVDKLVKHVDDCLPGPLPGMLGGRRKCVSRSSE